MDALSLFRAWFCLGLPLWRDARSVQVTKHAGSLQKGFALIAGIFVTAVVQSTLESSTLTEVSILFSYEDCARSYACAVVGEQGVGRLVGAAIGGT